MLTRAIGGLFWDLDLITSDEHQAAKAAVNTAVPFEEHLTEEQVVERNVAWRLHAEAVHSQLLAGMASLDKKAEDAFKFTAGLLTALVAVTFAAQNRTSCWIIAAMGFWLLAAFVFALMRRGFAVPGLPNAQTVRDRIFYPDSYDRWMAEVIHLMSVQVRLLCDIRAKQLNFGIALLVVGLIFLAIHVSALYFVIT